MNYLFSVKTHKTLYFKCWWNTNEKWSYIGPQTHQKKTLNKLQNVELVHKTLSDPNTKKKKAEYLLSCKVCGQGKLYYISQKSLKRISVKKKKSEIK